VKLRDTIAAVTGSRRLVRNPAFNRVAVRTLDSAAIGYHRSWKAYSPTPLRLAPAAAARLGVSSVSVKDESRRLGMPSFKILGASWAVHRTLCDYLGVEVDELRSVHTLRRRLSGHDLTLVTATDGNHGRAVARMARLLHLKAQILVPSDMVQSRRTALQAEGATVVIVEGGYDTAVAASAQLADASHLVISDTSWPGYDIIPGWVIDGYSTLSHELDTSGRSGGLPTFTVVAVQIGVGALAAAISRAFRGTQSRLVGVEPIAADCVVSSIEAGQIVQVPDDKYSIMAGLNCGAPSPVAWPDISNGIDDFAAIEDEEAEDAMRLLATDGIVAGESGAAGLAGLLAFHDDLALRSDDRVLVISTEGATDPIGYERVVGRAPERVLA
jgi:diaminopropionate ammonia-lyase